MSLHEQKKEILKKYIDDIRTTNSFYIQEDIPSRCIENAVNKFAQGLNKDSVIGFYDTTVAGSGKNGFLFTDTKVYYLETLEKPHKLWYDDIRCVDVIGSEKKDCDKCIAFYLYDNSVVKWFSVFMNKTPLKNFFDELIQVYDNESNGDNRRLGKEHGNYSGAYAGGISIGTYGTVNKNFDEEKFHARQGHGFAAERINDAFDKLTGHDAHIVGDDNAKNGADRVVDGIYIQSKYCATGSRCINECFANDGKGSFRYIKDGKPMEIEVPSDKYDAAVQAMEEKIRRGQVQGVTDPSEAKQIVRKGHFTYNQAKNIARSGTVESLTYDAVNGAVIASSAFGVTAIVTFATSVWNGDDFKNALKVATYSGLKVGGTAFASSIIASQLSKMGLNSALVSSSEAIASFMGPKASSILVNAFRSGGNIYGAAAIKSAAKLLRGNTITAGMTVVVLSTFDIANIFRGRISGKQLFKNLTSTATTVAGGTGGWVVGAALGSAVLPGIGTFVGGILGSLGAGAAAGKVTDSVMDAFIEDDADEMVSIIEKIFGEMANEYLLSQKEAEKSVDKLSDKLSGKLLKDMFASDNREAYARNILEPIIESVVERRQVIYVPSDEQLVIELKNVLEEISDYA